MKPNAGKEAFTKAAAMARHMDETYDNTEKLVQQAKLYAEIAKDNREKMERVFKRISDDVLEHTEKYHAVAARSFLALTLVNAVLCVGAVALSYYLMR